MRSRRYEAPAIGLIQMVAETTPRVWRTIRFRITAIATAAVALVLVATAWALIAVQQQRSIASLDATLVQRATEHETALGERGTLDQVGDDAFGQVATADGEVLLASGEAVDLTAPVTSPPIGTSAFRTLTLADEDDLDVYRVLAQRFELAGEAAILYVGTGTDEAEESSGILRVSLLIAVPTLVVLIALLVWWLVGRTLAPTEAIRARVDSMDWGDLASRVPVPAGDDEIARLAHTMNRMLDRIEGYATRQQRFVGDASHELRSPLTRMRTQLEVDLAHPPEESRAARESLLEEAIGLQRLVDDLLYLAKADEGAHVMTRRPVDLDDLALREARRLRANGRVRVDTSGVSAGLVVGDSDQLARVLRNLGENAERHAATTVTFTLTETESVVRLTVGDDGPGVDPIDRERIFERFGRTDEARDAETGGTGLGLAIARDIVEHHGGSLSAEAPRTGAVFVVELPRSQNNGP